MEMVGTISFVIGWYVVSLIRTKLSRGLSAHVHCLRVHYVLSTVMAVRNSVEPSNRSTCRENTLYVLQKSCTSMVYTSSASARSMVQTPSALLLLNAAKMTTQPTPALLAIQPPRHCHLPHPLQQGIIVNLHS